LKGKVILLSSAVLLMVFAVAPVMACTSVPATVTTTTFLVYTPGSTYTTPSGFTVQVGGTLDAYAALTIDNTVHPVYSVNTYFAITSPNGDSYTQYDATWYVETSYVTLQTANGFSGHIEMVGTTSSVGIQCVLQGFGSFRGQTLMVSYSGPTSGELTWNGVDMMH